MDDERDDGDPGVRVEMEEVDKEPHQEHFDQKRADAGGVEFGGLEWNVLFGALEDPFAVHEISGSDGNNPTDDDGNLELDFVAGVEDSV